MNFGRNTDFHSEGEVNLPVTMSGTLGACSWTVAIVCEGAGAGRFSMKCPNCGAAFTHEQIVSWKLRCKNCGTRLFVSGRYRVGIMCLSGLIGGVFVWVCGAGWFWTMVLFPLAGLPVLLVLMSFVPRIIPPKLVLYDVGKMLTTLDLSVTQQATEELPSEEEPETRSPQMPRLSRQGIAILVIAALWAILLYTGTDSKLLYWIAPRLPRGTGIVVLCFMPLAVMISDVRLKVFNVLRLAGFAYQLLCLSLLPIIYATEPKVALATGAAFCIVAFWIVPKVNRRLEDVSRP